MYAFFFNLLFAFHVMFLMIILLMHKSVGYLSSVVENVLLYEMPQVVRSLFCWWTLDGLHYKSVVTNILTALPHYIFAGVPQRITVSRIVGSEDRPAFNSAL